MHITFSGPPKHPGFILLEWKGKSGFVHQVFWPTQRPGFILLHWKGKSGFVHQVFWPTQPPGFILLHWKGKSGFAYQVFWSQAWSALQARANGDPLAIRKALKHETQSSARCSALDATSQAFLTGDAFSLRKASPV